MINNKSILVVILARGGSKRLPKKNIKPLDGKPMIVWSIEAALKSKYVDRVVVSTDSQEIASISKKAGAQIPFIRPAELAADETTSADSLIHAVKEVTKDGDNYDILIYLQPTSPLRNNQHLDEAIETFISHKKADSLVSVMEVDKNPYWIQSVNKKGIMKPHFKRKNIHWSASLTQKLYIPNGSIYIIKLKDFLKNKKLYTNKTIPYVMDKIFSVDIDEELDFKMTEFFLNLSKGSK